jgi:Single-strand binding protein family
MSVSVLVSGSIFREPIQKTSQAGKPYTVATIKAGSGENAPAEYWSVLCFSDSGQEQLLRLGLNEKLSVQGSMKVELFEKDGQQRISRTIFVDHVLALRAPPREKKPKPSATPASAPLERVSILPSASSPDLDDDIPF